MCGITGIFYFDRARVVEKEKLITMTNEIIHRGPDGSGYYLNMNIGLGHRRLSIIDLKTGDQPMSNDDNSIVVVFNGEIYNYIELSEELIQLGAKFKTVSDTEVIIKAYEQWGIECQNKFNGMWAFALWDGRKEQLFLSRDRIGEKPLHYSVYNDSLIFGSELKSLFEYGIPRELRKELIEIYLVLTNIPGPDSFYNNVYKLKPGHYIVANSGGIKELKYWDLPYINELDMYKDSHKIYNNFSYLLDDSVKLRMRSDVPYGAFLSGGLDSSSVVSLMVENSDLPIETFTIRFPERLFDESILANEVATKFKTNHNVGTVKSSELSELLSRSAYYFDEPFGDSSAIPTWQVSNFAAQKVKMVLTGDGGDEVLSGYPAYLGIKFSGYFQNLPKPLRYLLPLMARVIKRPFQGSTRYFLNRVEDVLSTANLSYKDRFYLKRSYTSLSNIKKLTERIEDKIDIEDYINDIIVRIPYKDDFYKHMYINLKYDLPDDYLVKVDRMSMANSLETRIPFLDYRLLEFMVCVDKNIKMNGWERKSILRRTVAKRLPPSILKAPKKGFAVPLREWFKDGDIDFNIYLENIRELMDEVTISRIIDENRLSKRDNGDFIWTLMMLNKFIN